jgi:tetratricopeptide (TPR) repeat protein
MIFISGSLLFSEGCKIPHKKKVNSDASGNTRQVNFGDADYFIDACIQLGNGNYTLSIKNLEKCIKLNPNEASFYYQLSKNYNELSDPNLSLQNAMKAYNLAPDNIYYGLWYAEKLSSAGNLNEAIKVLQKAFSKNQKDEQVLKALDALYFSNANPIQDRIDLWLNHKESSGYKLNSSIKLIEFYIQIKQYSSAHLLYDEIKKASPLKYKYFVEDANLYLKENDEIHANENFEKAIALNPSDFNLNYSLFILKANKKTIDEANKYLKNAFSDPLTSLDKKLDVCQQINKNFTGDTFYLVYIKTLAQSLAINYPENPKSLFAAAIYFEKVEMYDDALKFYSKINELSPGMFDAWIGSLKMSSKIKKFNNTIEIANKALEYYPNVAQIYLEASIASNSINDFSKAIEFVNSGLSFAFDPKIKSQLLFEQATAYFKQNLFHEAETNLIEALKYNVKEGKIFDLLGNVNYKLNNTEKAIEFWKKAQSLGLISSVLDKKIKDGKYVE